MVGIAIIEMKIIKIRILLHLFVQTTKTINPQLFITKNMLLMFLSECSIQLLQSVQYLFLKNQFNISFLKSV